MIKDTAAIISKYNPKLAKAFIDQPFRRTLIAGAFEAGFKEPNKATELVHRVANLDVKIRQAYLIC